MGTVIDRRIADEQTDDGQNTIRKAYLSLQLKLLCISLKRVFQIKHILTMLLLDLTVLSTKICFNTYQLL